MEKRELWIGLVHLKPVIPGDWTAFERGEKWHDAGAYSNIITWASNAEGFRAHADKVASDYRLYVVDIEGEEPLSRRDRTALGEELQEIAERAETNPNAIIFGTFHMYPHEDA